MKPAKRRPAAPARPPSIARTRARAAAARSDGEPAAAVVADNGSSRPQPGGSTAEPSNALALRPPPPASGLVLRAPDLTADEQEELATGARAASTRRAYEGDLRRFGEWCAARGYPAFPAAPATLVRYVRHLVREKRAVSTIGRAVAAIARAHQVGRAPSPTADPAVRDVMAWMRREIGVAPRKKTPVRDATLRAFVRALGAGLAGLRDKALLLLTWASACRRSEVVALNVEDLEEVDEGFKVTIARSKTDQEAAGALVGVPRAEDPELCPVRSVRAWLDAAGHTRGALFRAVSKSGRLGARISGRALARIVQRAAKRAGLDPRLFGGHSLRSGFMSTAAERGKSLAEIMRQSRHRTERVALGYIRARSVFDAAKGLL